MNVFILNTGRCGSVTFIRACQHITNYTSSHESRCAMIGEERLNYPENHIEADNRLSWFLGRLDKRFGNDAFYVHLKRNINETARSYAKRLVPGRIIPAYKDGILLGLEDKTPIMAVTLDYCDTVNSNIEVFLKDKDKQLNIDLENIKQDFRKFWDAIGAEGDIHAALAEFDIKQNSEPPIDSQPKQNIPLRIINRLKELMNRN